MTKQAKIEEVQPEMNDFAIADYGDFEIYIKRAAAGGREYSNKIAEMEIKYRRKNEMVKKGQISDEGITKLDAAKRVDYAQIAAKYIVAGWKGKFKGVELPEFSEAEAAKLLADPENQLLFIDIMETAASSASFEKEQDEIEIKN